MTQSTIDDLVVASRPAIFKLLDRATTTLSGSPYVHRIRTSDPLSGTGDLTDGLTLVVSADNNHLLDLWSVLDALVTTQLGAILPGWRDGSRQDRHGVEALYLVPAGGVLRRLTIRLVPASGDDPGVAVSYRVVFQRDGTPPAAANPLPDLAATEQRRARSAIELLVEALVLLHLAHRHNGRGHLLSAYGDTVRARDALRDLVRIAMLPGVPGGGWLAVEQALELTAMGRGCLAALREFVATGPPRDTTELGGSVERCVTVAGWAAPETLSKLAGPIDSYRWYLGIADVWQPTTAGALR